MKDLWKVILIVFGIFGLIWLIAGPVAIISPGERGVVVNKGKVTGQVYSEGWYVFNSITKNVIQFDTRTQINEEEIAAASKDLQDVNMTIVAQYRIDPNKVAYIVKNIGRQKDIDEKIIDPAIQEVIKASTSKFPVADVIRERAELKDKIEKQLAERLLEYGILLDEVSIKNIVFSEEFTKAIELKQVAEQGKQQAEYEAQATVAIAEGEARKQELLQESLTPLVLQRLYLEAWNGQLPQVMSDGNMIYQLP